MSQFDYQLLEYIQSAVRSMKAQPLFLGGISAGSGGGGGPPGGFIGVLPQTKVAYDYTEAASLSTPFSGMSLLDNLNHLRYRVGVLEGGGGSGTFLGLLDTPDSYLTYSGYMVVVNDTEDGLEFVPVASGGSVPPLTPDRIVLTDSAGNLITDNRIKYNPTNGNFVVGELDGVLPTDEINTIHIFGETSSPALFLWAFGNSISPFTTGARYRGTESSPAALEAGDILYRFRGRGYDGTSLSNTQAEFILRTNEVWSGSGHGTRAEVWITPDETTAMVEALRVGAGFIDIPSGYTYNIGGIPHTHGGGGGLTEVDFGTANVVEATFTITDASVTASSVILAQVAYVAPTGKDLDEVTMDNFDIIITPGAGQFTARMSCLSGTVTGKFKLHYMVV